jgi:hypothetical protein
MTSTIQTEPKRLIVILPAPLAGNIAIANKIYWLAQREQCDVLYLTLVDDYDDIMPNTRGMATMAAVTAGNIHTVTTKMVKSSEWLITLREISRLDDIFICQTEQAVKQGLLGTLPLGEYLQSAFPNRIMMISGYYKPVKDQINRLASTLLFLLGILVIFGLFTALEISLDRNLTGPVHTIMLGTVVFIEFGVVYAWNNLVSR